MAMAMPATPSWLSWLGLRRSANDAAAMRCIPSHSLKQLIGARLPMRSDGDRADVIATLTNWIARQERSMGGGALDLVVFPDALWRQEAVRALTWLEGERMAAPGTCDKH